MTWYVRASMTPEFLLLTPTLFQLSSEITKEDSHMQIKSMHTMHFVCAQLLRPIWLFATLWTVIHQAPLPIGFFQARIPKWDAIPSFRGSSQPQKLNLDLLHCRQSLYQLSYPRPPHPYSPRSLVQNSTPPPFCMLSASQSPGLPKPSEGKCEVLYFYVKLGFLRMFQTHCLWKQLGESSCLLLKQRLKTFAKL